MKLYGILLELQGGFAKDDSADGSLLVDLVGIWDAFALRW